MTVSGAGRTDAGVHACGQVAAFTIARELGPDAIVRALNAHLPHAVRVIAAEAAPAGFHPRFGARAKTYRYRMWNDEVMSPFDRGYAWHIPGALDVDAMAAAARPLVGRHDFASYCKPREGATTIRELQAFTWERDADGVLVARLQADAFCRSMVRALVGACVAIGGGKLTATRAVELRESVRRSSEFVVMPAKGLTLTEVGYPPDAELASRAEQTRARRTGLPESQGID